MAKFSSLENTNVSVTQHGGTLAGRRVLIFQQRNWGTYTGHFLAKKFQAEGCRLAALTLKRSTHEFILNQGDVTYDLVINNDEIMSRPKDYLAGDVFALADICRDLAIDSIWPLVYSLRNHVRSYQDKYYYGFKQNVSDEGIIDYVMAVYKYITHIFQTFKPDVIISPNFVALPHIMMSLYAKQRGVKMIGVTDCKVRDTYLLVYNHLDSEGPFYDRVKQLHAGVVDSSNRQRAKAYIAEFRAQFKKPAEADKTIVKKTLWKKIKSELRPYYQIIQWYIHRPINVLESTGITIDFRPPKIILRDHYCNKRYKKYMNRFDYYPFDALKKFVYFPLKFQPEASIDVIAPYFSNQIETARQVAMSLPDEYVLAVKEHPEMVGLRPPSYIEKLNRTPNVTLIDHRIPNEAVLKKMDLLICPNGTALTEAAFYNKPAIQLGDLGTTLQLPNVFRHTDMTTLAAKIKEVLAIDLHTPEYERRLENYVAAAYDAGFEYDLVGAWGGGSPESLENFWIHLKNELLLR